MSEDGLDRDNTIVDLVSEGIRAILSCLKCNKMSQSLQTIIYLVLSEKVDVPTNDISCNVFAIIVNND